MKRAFSSDDVNSSARCVLSKYVVVKAILKLAASQEDLFVGKHYVERQV